MRTAARTTLVLLLAALAAVAARAADEAVTVREGRWFRVVCHFEHARAADDALAAVEAAGPVAADLYGLHVPTKENRLEVHLYRTIADYEAVEERLTGGRFKRNLAFAHYATRSAHVALQPPVSDAVLDRLGLPLLTQNLLAHEAAHTLRYRWMPAYGDHPMWLVDGAAIHVALQAEIARGRIASVEGNPLSATDIGHGRRLLDEGRLPPATRILEDGTDGLSFYERYAVRWLLFRYLATGPHAEAFAKVMRQVPDMRGGDGFRERLRARVLRAAGGAAALDAEFVAWTRALAPAWEEIFRSLDANGETWGQAAFPGTNAIAWRTAPAPEGGYDLTGRFELLPGEGVQMNALLDRTPEGFVSVAMRSDGWVTVFEYEAAADRWTRRASFEREGLEKAAGGAFVLRVRPASVSVAIDDAPAVEVDLPGRTMRGSWGLGVQAGTCGLWREIRATPAQGD